MAELLTVGEFSRLTHLTVKTLRHYHEEEVLPPARVDDRTGYRYYAPDQVPDALLVRRLRAVRMPLPDIRAVLATGDDDERRTAVVAHLERLRLDLVATAAAVASLQALLTRSPDGDGTGPTPQYREEPARSCLAETADVDVEGIAGWSSEVYPRLFAAAAGRGLLPTGPAGALYGEEWFEQGRGPVTAYVPVTGGDVTLPAQLVATVVHAGPFSEIDRSYAALGRHVHEQGLGAPGPVREVYLTDPSTCTDPADLRTEVCWPIAHRPREV